jgi:hypothetical protein
MALLSSSGSISSFDAQATSETRPHRGCCGGGRWTCSREGGYFLTAEGLSENVAHGRTGYVTPRRSPERLVEPLRRLATAPGERQRLGMAGRERAHRHFRTDVQCDRFEALYRTALATPAEERKRRQHEALCAELGRVERELAWLEEVERTQEVVERLLPATATVAVTSGGDDRLLELGTRQAWHWPQAPDGNHLGQEPAGSDEAIEHLESARAGGAEFLVLPPSGSWWLDRYVGFRDHLDAHHGLIGDDSAGIRIYSLSLTSSAAVAASSGRRHNLSSRDKATVRHQEPVW